jgi:hypothetical protein
MVRTRTRAAQHGRSEGGTGPASSDLKREKEGGVTPPASGGVESALSLRDDLHDARYGNVAVVYVVCAAMGVMVQPCSPVEPPGDSWLGVELDDTCVDDRTADIYDRVGGQVARRQSAELDCAIWAGSDHGLEGHHWCDGDLVRHKNGLPHLALRHVGQTAVEVPGCEPYGEEHRASVGTRRPRPAGHGPRSADAGGDTTYGAVGCGPSAHDSALRRSTRLPARCDAWSWPRLPR